MGKHVGGQAVIEGVMMRNGEKLATAIRKDGTIKVKKENLNPISKRYKFLGWPFMRGVVSLVEMMYTGTKALMWSASEAGEEDEQLSNSQITLTIIVSFFFAIALFVGLPYILTYLLGISEQNNPVLFNLIDGLIKLIILVSYIYLIGLMPDIRKVFQYHGAEHKTIHTYERNRELNVRNVKPFPTAHSRCGTSFLMIVILIGVFIFSFIPLIAQAIYPIYTLHPVARYVILFAARIMLLPVVAGISYEWLKLTPMISTRSWLYWLNYPGMWVQRLTTREPTDDQIEVAIAALNAVTEK